MAAEGFVSALQDMSKNELQAMLEHDQILDSFVAANVDDNDSKMLVEELRQQNLELARSNIEDAERVSKLQRKVENARITVKQRQESLKPAIQRVASYQQKTTKAGMIDKLNAAIREAEARCEAVAARGESQDADWESIVSDYIKECKPVHYRKALLERLETAAPQ